MRQFDGQEKNWKMQFHQTARVEIPFHQTVKGWGWGDFLEAKEIK